MKRVYKIISPDSGKKYEVWDNDGIWSCECPHWMHRLRHIKAACKHIDIAKDFDRKQAQLQAELEGDVEWDWEKPLKPNLFGVDDDD